MWPDYGSQSLCLGKVNRKFNKKIKHMKKTFSLLVLAVGLLVAPACTGVGTLSQVSANRVGSVGQVIYGTVISARNVTIDTDSSTKNMGTVIGAAVGAGAGQMLGGGSGRVVSTVGFGALGALAGRGLAKYGDQTQGQVLTIRADGKNGATYNVTQPVYKEIGYIPVGCHGTLQLGGDGKFIPDGI